MELSWYITGSSQSGPYQRLVKTARCDTRDLQGEVEDLVGKGYMVKIEAVELPEEHPDQVKLEDVPAWKKLGHWAGCSCASCSADRARRFP